ncbi:peptidoglycan-binding protein [Streptomyces sp. NPDC059063]|uniref:peptidoglycan-binding domain-containing protein n=1 Tax=unclassified Streptomyces TaxID=2593676 RepID=UPI00368580A9
MRTPMKVAAVAGLVALAVSTGAALTASPADSATAASTQARAEPHCNYIDDSARPIIRDGAPSPRGAVPQVQCLINTYSNQSTQLPVDGILGVRTRAAIRSVQSCNQVSEPPGVIVGRPTWEVLYNPIPSCARPHPAR